MKKFMGIFLASICCIMLVACNSSSDHTGEAKTPSGSSIMNGRNYESVIKSFEENGFTNIKLEKIEDLVIGWLTEDGEVEEVSVGGDFEYLPDEWVPADTEVIIRYHTFPQEETELTELELEENTNLEDTTKNNNQNIEAETVSDEVLTINNCKELANILSNKSEIDESYLSFASKYAGRTIEFDGRIDYLVNHENYNTRYDILVSAGDYDPNSQIGPTFKFKDVGAYDLDLETLYLEDEIEVGKNVRIIAKVGKFDSNSMLFFLDPISVTSR